MSNIGKLAKSLAKNVNQRGYVTLDQAAFEKIKAALDVAARLSSEAGDDELMAVAAAGLEAAQDLAKSMPLGHAYDILSRMNGLKDFNSLSVALAGVEPSAEKREQVKELDGSIEYRMAAGEETSPLWIEVGAISVYINRTHEGVIVDLFATGCEDEESLGSTASEWLDAEEIMRRAGRGWVIYSPNESATSEGAGFWSNLDGWVEDEEATVFTDAEKERMALPVSTGEDARWVSLSERHTELTQFPVHILDDEQPTTCPQCGSRTDFEELPDGRQHHTCPACSFEFIGEFDEDSQDTR